MLCQLFLPYMKNGNRILFIGTETANDGIAGKVPPVADLGTLDVSFSTTSFQPYLSSECSL
jgi:hypothetical protein